MKIFNKKAFVISIITFLVIGAFYMLFDLPILNSFKDAFTDYSLTDNGLVQVRKGQYKTADTNIVIINILELKADKLKNLIDLITLQNPKVIGLNLDEYEADTSYKSIITDISSNPIIVIGDRTYNFENKSKNVYYSNVGDGDSNHIVRDFAPFTEINGITYKSFYAAIIEKYNQSIYKLLTERKNKIEIINYRGNYTQFFFVPSEDIFNNDIDSTLFKDKIIILGKCPVQDNFKELGGYYFTPINEDPMSRSLPDMFLPEIQANILSMIIDNSYIFVMPMWANLIISFILIYLNFSMFLFIIEKKESLYELVSLIIFLVESFILLLLDVQFFREYNIESGLTVSLIALAIGLLMFEVCMESLIPLYRIFRDKRRKN